MINNHFFNTCMLQISHAYAWLPQLRVSLCTSFQWCIWICVLETWGSVTQLVGLGMVHTEFGSVLQWEWQAGPPSNAMLSPYLGINPLHIRRKGRDVGTCWPLQLVLFGDLKLNNQQVSCKTYNTNKRLHVARLPCSKLLLLHYFCTVVTLL
jgi:hypothetical protein